MLILSCVEHSILIGQKVSIMFYTAPLALMHQHRFVHVNALLLISFHHYNLFSCTWEIFLQILVQILLCRNSQTLPGNFCCTTIFRYLQGHSINFWLWLDQSGTLSQSHSCIALALCFLGHVLWFVNLPLDPDKSLSPCCMKYLCTAWCCHHRT